jgi:hypothetical protein
LTQAVTGDEAPGTSRQTLQLDGLKPTAIHGRRRDPVPPQPSSDREVTGGRGAARNRRRRWALSELSLFTRRGREGTREKSQLLCTTYVQFARQLSVVLLRRRYRSLAMPYGPGPWIGR